MSMVPVPFPLFLHLGDRFHHLWSLLEQSYEYSEQRTLHSERTPLLPKACLFIPGRAEHWLDGAVRARSIQGQSGEWQRSLVSKQLSSGVQSHTYECMIILSRETMAGEWVSVQHPLSWEGFPLGLQDCPDKELVQFILQAIESGAALGTSKTLLSKDPFRCRNGRMSGLEAQPLREEVVQGLWAQHKIGPFAELPFAGFWCSPVNGLQWPSSPFQRKDQSRRSPYLLSEV